MGYISQVQIGNAAPYLIEPILFASAGGTSTALTADIAQFELVTGVLVYIKVGLVNANATLNVNETGAKFIYYNGTNITNLFLSADHIYIFVYSNEHWNVVGDILEKNIEIGTTLEWAARSSYIAPRGRVIIYTDRGLYVNNGVTITVPGIKISDGLAYAVDLPFVGDDVIAAVRSELNAHINDNVKHITSAERTFWNNKLNYGLEDERLILNRL